MLMRRLHRLGWDVLTAANGREALTKASAWKPDLVLLDLSLPLMDGWNVARRLKSDPATYRIPIVALTANVLADERDRALSAGCDEYETKPVNLPRLLEKIEALLSAETSA